MLRFNFSVAMWQLYKDICGRLPQFAHVNMNQVAVAFAQARRRVPYGLQAKLVPMRFRDGYLTVRRGRRDWTIQRLYHGDVEILYIVIFYLPRFLDHCFREKMITIMHELYHISPDFNGDIRRLPGQYHVHSRSQKEYDQHMAVLVDQYLALEPPDHLYRFLNNDFRELHTRFGGVTGMRVPIPKLIPLPKAQ